MSLECATGGLWALFEVVEYLKAKWDHLFRIRSNGFPLPSIILFYCSCTHLLLLLALFFLPSSQSDICLYTYKSVLKPQPLGQVYPQIQPVLCNESFFRFELKMLDKTWRLFEKEDEENKGWYGGKREIWVNKCLMSPNGL